MLGLERKKYVPTIRDKRIPSTLHIHSGRRLGKFCSRCGLHFDGAMISEMAGRAADPPATSKRTPGLHLRVEQRGRMHEQWIES